MVQAVCIGLVIVFVGFLDSCKSFVIIFILHCTAHNLNKVALFRSFPISNLDIRFETVNRKNGARSNQNKKTS